MSKTEVVVWAISLLGCVAALSPAAAGQSTTATTPAKTLFGHKTTPAPLAPNAIGFYSRGCLAGGVALSATGDTWQVMRLSRQRNWGHPNLISFLKRFSAKARAAGWPGILVGDMAQARGGPMLTGHASHQVGLDADIWLTPMPTRELTRKEREEISAVNMVRRDRRDIAPAAWTPKHQFIVRAAAEDAEVARVFVNPAIKKALCREAGSERAWLNKVRPWYGHDYHMHVRLGCPPAEIGCTPQDPPPPGDGCGADLDYWFQPQVLNPPPPKTPPKPSAPLTLKDLPAACSAVISAP
jgi:penicillin-insensitive murein endopeptidase